MQIRKTPYLSSYEKNTMRISDSESQEFLNYLPVRFAKCLFIIYRNNRIR